jgi:hypothetical protein
MIGFGLANAVGMADKKVRPTSGSEEHYTVIIFSMGMDSLCLSITHGYA